MGTECQLDFSDEDSKMLDEAEERGVVIPECFQEVPPDVERALREDAERRLSFEDDSERREILREDLRPEDKERVDREKAQEQLERFRTLSGEFSIRQSPGSYLSIEEAKRIYREDTPHSVTKNMEGVASVNRVIQKGREITLGQRGVFRNDRGVNIIYRHPSRILKEEERIEALLSGQTIEQALKEKEIGTRHHEIGEEIYDRHLTLEEMAKCDKLHEEAIKGGWMREICDHSRPTSRQYTCDVYKMFKTDPAKLKTVHSSAFQFIQSKYISLEVEDTFTSLEREEE